MKKIIQYIIFYSIMTTSTMFTCPHDQDGVVMIQDKDKLEALLKNQVGPSLIYFYMNSCGWCSKIAPIIEKLSKNNKFDDITFYKVNGPQAQAVELINQHLHEKIVGYPTIFFMKQGKVVDKQIGGAAEDTIIKKLTALLKANKHIK